MDHVPVVVGGARAQRREQDLREVGYLRAAILEERGGLSRTLAEVNLEQRRLTCWAPATGYLDDVRAGAFHPPSSDTVRDFIGRSVLGLLEVYRWTDPAFQVSRLNRPRSSRM